MRSNMDFFAPLQVQVHMSLKHSIGSKSGAVVRIKADLFFYAQDIQPQAESGILYAPNFFLQESENPWFGAKYWEFLSGAQLREKFAKEVSIVPQINWQEPEYAYFADCFAQAQAMIASGELDKIVPVVFAESEFQLSQEHLNYFLLQISQAPAGLYGYGFWYGDQSMFGVTPELLFTVEGNELSSMALAGTRPCEVTDRLPLLEDSKELAEHSFVIHELKQKLALWGAVQIAETSILNLPSLQHLLTHLKVQLADKFDFNSVVNALHPTPALGGYPREASLKILQKWSGQRMRFGAPFAVLLPDGRSHCLVAIRNIQSQAGRVWLGSGCGVVRQSEVHREWDELARKRQSVLRILGLR